MSAEHKQGEGVEIRPGTMAGWWAIGVRFNDGKKGGHQHDRVYGFSVPADTPVDAKILLRSHLLRLIDVLNTELLAENR